MIWFLLPAFNEERGIEKWVGQIGQLAELQGWRYHIVVVDDGSDDRTVHILRKRGTMLPLTVPEHRRNLGPGRAFATGFEYVASQ
jgi:glycosyltransferase involved in cell wall biosynthesis